MATIEERANLDAILTKAVAFQDKFMPHFLNRKFENSPNSVTVEKSVEAMEQITSVTVESNSSNIKNKLQVPSYKALQPHQIVGNCYKVIKPLRVDQFCTSYLVEDQQSQQESLFVLELIYDAADASETMTEAAFLEQVALITKLSSHVQIPKLLSHVIENEQYYLVYEYTSGEVLDSILKYRPFTESEIINYVQDIARIYDFLIRGNIIDFQITAHNIIKSKPNHRYVLGNFRGVFSHVQSSASSTNKQQKNLFQQKIKTITTTVIHSLLGHYSTDCNSELTIPANWRKQVSLSPRLQAILTKMMAVDNSERYQSFTQLVDDFEPLLKIQQIIGNKYRLIRYLGNNNGIKTYIARNVANQNSNANLLIVKQCVIENKDRSFAAAKINYIEQEFQKIKALLSFKTNDLIREQFEDFEELYLVRDYIEGVSLTKKNHQTILYQPQQIIELLTKLIHSLTIVHQHNLIHRNLKPSNIVFSHEKQAFILVDFGILQTVNQPKNSANKSSQNRQPPEQIVGRPTFSSDIYALGLILIESISKFSLEGISYEEFLAQADWKNQLVNYPDLISLIERMIVSDVDLRYQSTKEILQDLEQITETKKPNHQHNNFYKSFNQNFKLKKLILASVGSICLLAGLEVTVPLIRPQYYTYIGKKQLQQPKTALINFEKALKLQPKKVTALEGKGHALVALQEFEPALNTYEQATQINSKSIASWQGIGNIFIKTGDLKKALNSYDRSLEIQPDNSNSLAKKAKVLYLLSRYEEALSLQKKALDLGLDSNVWFLKDLAQTSLALGKNNQALNVLNRIQNMVPQKPYLWQDKVLALRNLEHTQEALETAKLILNTYTEATENQSNDINLWLGKAAFLKQLKRYNPALEAYDSAIALKPNSHAAWLGKGETLLAMKQYSQALETVDTALKIEPQSFQAWHTQGLILQQVQQDTKQAITAYDKAIAINQDFFPAWRDRGILLTSQNNYSQGIESLQKAVALAPHDLESWLHLTDTFQDAQKIEEALAAIDQAIYLQPRNSSYWLKKGSLHEKQQQYTEACDVYRQAITIAPNWKITGAMQKLGCRSS